MFNKDSATTDKYKLNGRSALTVKNVKIAEGEGGKVYYRSTISFKHEAPIQDKPLVFNSQNEVSDFISNIDLGDNQLTIPGTGREDLN